MSTFNQPSSLGPGKIERDKEVPQDTGEIPERPSPEKVSPTQQGKFLGELEKKEKKKETKAISSEEKGEEEVEETDAGIFGLAGTSKVKSRKAVSEEEKGAEGGEEEGEEKEKPSQVAPILPLHANTQAQVHAQASAQAQAHAQAQNQAQQRVHATPTEEAPETEPIESKPTIAAPQTPVYEGPVREGPVREGPVREGPVREGPVREGPVREGPVREGPVYEQAVQSFADIAEEKERVAFQAPSAKKEAAPVVQPLPIAPQPEMAIKSKAPTAEEARVAREALIELFKQTVDAVATLVSKVTTTTVVTIKQPPIFEGASILVTEYSSAKKEYNITFSNLSPDARRLIETTGSETQLRQTLIDKGYTLHMMTIETQPFKTTTAGAETSTPEGRRKERGFEQGGRKEKESEGEVT